jgi:hypothetical protein
MDDPQAIDRTVQRLANNEDDDLSQTISKLNKKIRMAMVHLGDSKPYLIAGPNGGSKKIIAAGSDLVTFRTVED